MICEKLKEKNEIRMKAIYNCNICAVYDIALVRTKYLMVLYSFFPVIFCFIFRRIIAFTFYWERVHHSIVHFAYSLIYTPVFGVTTTLHTINANDIFDKAFR